MKVFDRNRILSLILTVAAVWASSVFPVSASDPQIQESPSASAEDVLSAAPAAGEVPDVAEKVSRESAAKAPVQDGYYRLVNVSSGKYLDVFSAYYDSLRRAHLDEKRTADSQIFALIRHANGSYSLCPKTDDTSTFLSLSAETEEGGYLSCVTESTGYSKFRLEKNADGSYAISPAAAELSGYALAESETERYNGLYSFCELQKRDAYADAQKWILESTGEFLTPTLRISETEATVKLYTISSVSAAAYPAAYNENIKWTSSDHKVAVVDGNGAFSALALGTTVLTAACGGESLSCTVTVGEKIATTWYSQCNLYSGGWNALPVSRLIFVSGMAKPFFLDNWNGKIDWMDEGCYLCCAAMVLHNLDARKTEGYDFRSGQTGNLPADPYTVALANTMNYGASSASEILYGDPILVGIHNIAAAFRVGGEPVTAQTTYLYSLAQIRDLLKDHPEGVIVGMANARGRHYVVMTECVNPDAANPDDLQFLVCDPGAYYPAQGNNVPFEQSYSYQSMYYRTWNFYEVTVLNAAQ
ncbi:MAG: RICIN domain-containing protein [Clostridia bacterium]|nr:RICIN domain-containing protein [Clostridia bacterium]